MYLGDVWPSSDEVHALLKYAMNPKAFRENYDNVAAKPGKLWNAIKGAKGQVYDWPHSTYIAEPPFFQGFTMTPKPLVAGVKGARIMALFGDSITTDHISPAGSIKASSPAGKYLIEQGVQAGGLQQLRLAPRPPRGDDARHLRQRAHQEPDDPGRSGRLARGRRRDAVPAHGREAVRSTTRPSTTWKWACRR